jgi:uncharacterized membrane protein YecN with MAPEG domain
MSVPLVLPALTTTSWFTGLCALVQIPITLAIALLRVKKRVAFLDGGDPVLLRLTRAHGNFTETVPITLLAMGAAELRGAPHTLLLTGGISLLAGRFLHYVTLARSGVGVGRPVGMALTLLPLALFGIFSLSH